MIKLIASDLDGTLISKSSPAVSERMIDLIKTMRRRGIMFCAASGRQYPNLRRLFSPVRDDIVYVCENGAAAFADDRAVSKTALPREAALELIDDVLGFDDCEVLISGERTSYLMPKHDDYYDHIRHFVGNDVTLIKSPADITEDILKVSSYCRCGTAKYEPILLPKWGRNFSAVVAGSKWIDATLADKGTALRQMCSILGVLPDEVVCFGDNFNDVPMFRFSGLSYAMASAADGVRAEADSICTCVEDEVEKLLNNL